MWYLTSPYSIKTLKVTFLMEIFTLKSFSTKPPNIIVYSLKWIYDLVANSNLNCFSSVVSHLTSISLLLINQQQMCGGLTISPCPTGRKIGDTVLGHLLLVNLHVEYVLILFAYKGCVTSISKQFHKSTVFPDYKIVKNTRFFFFKKVHILFPSVSKNRKFSKEKHVRISCKH